ncbi:MAG: alkaline phosphatase family protein, partial [Actinomycetota bacterium]|nr:alkaline phosphatase family protein [Actinomycetota bacterium]
YTSVVSTGEGVSVNLRGREPQGTVDRKDYERVRSDLAAALAEFRDPDTGGSPIGKIYRKEEVLSGRFLDTAPDLVLVPAPLYSLTHAKGMVEEADWLSGDHRLEGVLVAAGPGVTAGRLQERARLIDLGPTAMASLGVSSAVTRDGAALTSLTGGARLETSSVDVSPVHEEAGTGLTSDEEDEIEDHLRGLGYVE